MSGSAKPTWDLFIAHASEDKDGFVRPLAEQLNELGVRVWYDEFQLKPGDSLVKTIDRGLANSAFGLLIVSQAFLRKPWPDYERRGLVTRELMGNGVVIPVWRNVTQVEVVAFSPSLADKYAITSGDVTRVSLEVLQVVRPDLFESLSRRIAYERYVQSLPTKEVPIADILVDIPPRHHSLPKPLMYRLLLIQEAVCDAFPSSFEKTVENFQRDIHPEEEATVWELLAATYLHIVREDNISPEGRSEILDLALKASMRPLRDEDGVGLAHTTVARFLQVRHELMQRITMFD